MTDGQNDGGNDRQPKCNIAPLFESRAIIIGEYCYQLYVAQSTCT